MALNILSLLKNLKYLSHIKINFDGLDSQESSGKDTDLLYLESSICPEINKLIDTYAKRYIGEDANELKSLYRKLVQIEIRALNGYFVPDEKGNLNKDAINLRNNYITTLKQIKSFRKFDASIKNLRTGERFSALYSVENLAYLTELRNRVVAKLSMEELEDLDNSGGFIYLAGLLKELRVNNSKLLFNASGAFGRDFINAYEQGYSSVKDFNYFMFEIEQNETKLEDVQYYFRDFTNAELFVDGFGVPFCDIDDDFRERLSLYVFCNLFSTVTSDSPDSKKIEYTPFDKFVRTLSDDGISNLSDQQLEAVRSAVNRMGIYEPIQKPINESTQKAIAEPEQVNKKVEAKFKNIIGLVDVKQQIKDMLNFCNKLKSINKFSMKNNHMCFLGNPGTGKTTVARIIAQTLFEEGFLNSDKVVEIGGVELKGEYVGQTAPKVKDLIKQSEGGILFIDEAYQICEGKRDSDKGDNFGNDALAVLIKEMEDNPNLMVIFAGYEEQTKRMIKINQGLESRIGTKIMFENYSTDELIKIAKRIAKENTYKLDASAEKVLRQEIEKHIKDKDFANGRFVRNLVIKAERIQTRRAQIRDFTLTGQDFLGVIENDQKVDKDDNEKKNEQRKQVGFGIRG